MSAQQGSWRCFVGVPLSDEIREPLARLVAEWRPELEARWTDPDGWHCSLHFIGDMDPRGMNTLATALAAAVGSRRRFALDTGGLGAFPSTARARVLYYAVADPDRELERLAHAAAGAAADSVGGEGPSRAFRGHVTLARLRRPAGLATWLAQKTTPAGRLDVTEACLMRSHLGAGPARYERLACFPLAGVAA